MNQLTEKEFNFYLKNNCEIIERPECSECNNSYSEVYNDTLSGNLYCYDCLFRDLSKDDEAIKELREEMGKK